jgi:hypothetical protein
MQETGLGGIGLIVFLSVFTLKLVDLLKEKIPLLDRFSYYLPVLSVGIGLVLAYGIKPLGLFSLLGVEGVVPWIDKLFTGLVIGLGASFVWDLVDWEG